MKLEHFNIHIILHVCDSTSNKTCGLSNITNHVVSSSLPMYIRDGNYVDIKMKIKMFKKHV